MTHLNLIHVFDFYLAAACLLGIYRRWEQYRAVAGLLVAFSGRWPKLLELMREHRTIFLSWSTLVPAVMALTLSVIHSLACRLVWPRATLTVADLPGHWAFLPFILLTCAAMLAVDGYFLIRVGRIDRLETEKYFDRAEYWLTGWQAPVVAALTFGQVNPKKMVNTQVREALVAAHALLNWSLWWVAVQAGLRVCFGLTLWSTWAAG